MKTLKILSLCIAAFVTLGNGNASAIPAKRTPIVRTQSDGSTITVRLFGDEFYNFATTIDGYTLVPDENGDYTYAIAANGQLESSGVRANDPGRRGQTELNILKNITPGLRSGAAASRAAVLRGENNERRMLALNSAAPDNRVSSAVSNSETLKCLVILVNFSDVAMRYSSGDFNSLLNQENYGTGGAFGSVRDYYKDNSNERLIVDFTTAGPYTLSQNRRYYGGNNTWGDDQRPREMVKEAFAMATADPSINLADFTTNGNIEHLFIIYAGKGEADGGPAESIWPHEWQLASPYTLNGVTINVYACSPELKGSDGTLTGIGVICHEFGHVLGYPDFYDTDYDTGGLAFGLDVFSVMDAGGYLENGMRPPALTSYERYMKEWLEYTEITEPGMYILEPVYGDKGYLINSPNRDEYFVFENRNGNSLKWDNFLNGGDPGMGVSGSGSGMIAYHVDQSSNNVGGITAANRWRSNSINNYSSHECMRIVMADQIYRSASNGMLIGSIGKIFFPGESNVTSFTFSGSPSFRSWANQSTGLDIYKVEMNGDNVILTVSVTGEEPGNNNILVSVDEAGQTYLSLSWFSEAEGEWEVKWAERGSEDYSSERTTEKSITIEGLKFNTAYTITVTNTTDASVAASITANTLGIPYIDMNFEYTAGADIPLSLKNVPDNVKSIVWRINGDIQANTVIRLSAGEYQVDAQVINADDSVEYFRRYISVR